MSLDIHLSISSVWFLSAVRWLSFKCLSKLINHSMQSIPITGKRPYTSSIKNNKQQHSASAVTEKASWIKLAWLVDSFIHLLFPVWLCNRSGVHLKNTVEHLEPIYQSQPTDQNVFGRCKEYQRTLKRETGDAKAESLTIRIVKSSKCSINVRDYI